MTKFAQENSTTVQKFPKLYIFNEFLFNQNRHQKTKLLDFMDRFKEMTCLTTFGPKIKKKFRIFFMTFSFCFEFYTPT